MTRTLKVLLACLVFALAAGSLLEPIRDFDFFWHLRTGEWIAEHRALPHEYLFSATANPRLDTGTRFTMTSYWLAQVVIHLFYSAGGFGGIVAMRFLLLGLLVAALARMREGDDFVFLGLLALFVFFLRIYLFERPQAFSFVFFAFLLLALERIRRPRAADGRPGPWPAVVPPLMLLWANCHGGFVVGQGVIALYLAAETVKRLHPALGPLPAERYRVLLLAGIAGLAASLVNPNTWHAVQVARLPAWMTALNLEYATTPRFFAATGSVPILVYWALLVLAALGSVRPPPRFDLTRFALLAATGAVSFTQVRHTAFFAIAALPVAAALLSRPRVLAAGRWLALGPALAIALPLLWADRPVFASAPRGIGVDRGRMPVEAADFLLANRPEGNLYNVYGWGGYLLWRLAPAKVFIDGRNSDRMTFDLAMDVDNGDSRPVGGIPFWKSILKVNGVRCTVTPFYDLMEGSVYPLLDALLADPDWVPVHADPIAVVFVEDVPANRGVIERHAIPKDRLLPLLLGFCEARQRSDPGDFAVSVARGDLLRRLHRDREAREVYAAAARMAPLNPTLRKRLARLDREARP